MNLPDVYSYRDYREFIRDVFNFNKGVPHFTHRYVARKLKVSHCLLSDVIAARRNLPLNHALELANLIGLAREEREFLLLLILCENRHENVSEHFKGLIESTATQKVSQVATEVTAQAN